MSRRFQEPEALLREALGAVARAAVPDETPFPGLATDAVLASSVEGRGRVRAAPARMVRRLGPRGTAASGVATAVVASVVGLAAAGVIGGSPQAERVAGQLHGAAGVAIELTLPAYHFHAPGEETRVEEPGPEGTTLTVRSASANPHSGCVVLNATGPDGALVGGPGGPNGGGCVATLGEGSTPPPPLASYGIHEQRGSLGSSTSYAFVFGEGLPGTTRVELFTPSGQEAASAIADQGWFVVDTPADQVLSGLAFYGANGQLLGTRAGSFG